METSSPAKERGQLNAATGVDNITVSGRQGVCQSGRAAEPHASACKMPYRSVAPTTAIRVQAWKIMHRP